MTTTVIITAAGTGDRMGGKTPKQYMPMGSVPILVRSAYAFLNRPDVDRIVIVIHPSHLLHYQHCMPYFGETSKLAPHVIGGETRGESVFNGLNAVACDARPDHVIVHDAARPMVRRETIDHIMAALHQGQKAIVPVIPVHDAPYTTDDSGRIVPLRTAHPVFAVQTPQGFDFNTLHAAYQTMKGFKNRDEAEAVINASIPVHTIPGDPGNFKITTPDDITRAENIMRQQQITEQRLCV